MKRPHSLSSRPLAVALIAWTLSGCALRGQEPPEPPPSARPETLWLVTDDGALWRAKAGRPQVAELRLPVQGLAAGERLVGIDFRVARGVLYGLGSSGRLYTLDTATGRASPVGQGAPVTLQGQRFGFDFNPVADRVRVVSDSGQNLRLHPDTGVLAATDPPLSWAQPGSAEAPRVAGAGYTYNTRNDKLTTNYAIDLAAASLITQGSVEAASPVVSPNTGQLFRVGALGTGPLEDAALDIADRDNTALAALRQGGRTRLYRLDLATGQAQLLGTLGDGRAVWGLAIEP